MRNLTLKKRINYLVIGSLAIVSTIIFFVSLGYLYVKYNASRSAYIESLSSSFSSQTQVLLPALLVEEQRDGLTLQLEKIRLDEDLSEIYFASTKDIEFFREKFNRCTFSKVITTCNFESYVLVAGPLEIGGKSYGHLIKVKKVPTFSVMSQQMYVFELIVLVLFLIFVVQFFNLSKLTSEEVPNSLSALLAWINSELSSSEKKISKPSLQFEEFNQLAEKISILIKENEQQKIQAKIGLMASQVSHDIRSPLAALGLITSDLSQVPEEKRLIIRSAVSRINDIANQLLAKGKEVGRQGSTPSPVEIILIAPLVDTIVSEKRIQIREMQSIEIVSDFSKSYGVFVKINTIEIKRALSNIIQNSIEAYEGRPGKITISIEGLGQDFVIRVDDDGKGIPSDILAKLGSNRLSFGKSGTGLGVSHAKNVVESSGGQFIIESVEGKGTTVKMIFKKEESPKWFVDKISISPNTLLVSLDDEISIHQLWNRKILSKEFSNLNLQHLTFTSCQDFKEQFECNEYLSKHDVIFLIDYDFLNREHTGLDIIEQLGIGEKSILVTSYYEDEAILSRCHFLKVKLIPKNMVAFVPLVNGSETMDYILIDDDPIVHLMWKAESKNRDRKFAGFYSYEDFIAQQHSISYNAKIYIDSNLTGNVKGEEVAKIIYNQGYENIYLCTGYDADSFAYMPWIKGIVGKTPLFG